MLATPSYAYNNISTATTTTVKTGTGLLHNITINKTANGTITINDGAVAIGVLKASVLEGTYLFDVAFATGLSIITASTSDITVSYR